MFEEQEEGLQLLNWLDKVESAMNNNKDYDLKPIPENVLTQYINLPNRIFLNDGISIETQKEFEVAYSVNDERIVLPYRDELNVLCGVKARATRTEDEEDCKYIYHYPCSKTKILYGLNKTLPFIKQKNEVIIVEAEKSVMKLWDYGFKNAVSLSSKTISEIQAEKIIRLGVDVVIALDKDVTKKEVQKVINEFRLFTNTYVVWDKYDLLDEKESPCDNIENWLYLYKRRLFAS